MYIKEDLDEVLINNGYIRVQVENDWHGIVKEKYKEVVDENKDNNLTILDTRCPKTIETISNEAKSKDIIVPKIHPILIHCGIEISERDDLRDKSKVVTTPCESLADYGNKLNLKDTSFISWKVFLQDLDEKEKIKRKVLDESPIPLGYFTSFGSKITSISGKENIENYFENGLHKKDKLVEMLYCNNGCNNGDGVLISE